MENQTPVATRTQREGGSLHFEQATDPKALTVPLTASTPNPLANDPSLPRNVQNNIYFEVNKSPAQAPAPLLSPETDRILYEAESPNVTDANFEVVDGDVYDALPPPNFVPPPAPASPPADRPAIDILGRSRNAQAQYATFSFVRGNRYKDSSNQTRGRTGDER